MNFKKLFLDLGKWILSKFKSDEEVKEIIIGFLEDYVEGTDNEVDDKVVEFVREKLLPKKEEG